jgi:hypothetical protein
MDPDQGPDRAPEPPGSRGFSLRPLLVSAKLCGELLILIFPRSSAVKKVLVRGSIFSGAEMPARK